MYQQKSITLEEYKAKQKQEIEELKSLPLEERLENTLNKMIGIATAGTGASVLYADMLLGMLPNSTHKVNIAYWCYKADRDDFYTILELMEQIKEASQIIWEYESYVSSHRKELEKIVKGGN